ncbi:uncharacterized protein gogo [Anabrus simplex]|uniref:uncharacterized protein gogo n=1 Tax=Anabrus simplex TaxID=316456 RepID=UPI0035A32D26
MCRAWEVRVPQNHTALSGDLTVTVIGTPPRSARLELLRATQAGSTRFAPIGSVPLPPAPSGPNTTTPDVEVRFPCGLFTQGGSYGIVLVIAKPEERPIQELDVRWPAVVLNLAPARIQTYPELPVTATLEFPGIKCRPAAGAVVPELWMELLFCGHSPIGCTDTNATHKQVMYAEQLRGYRRLSLKLSCELFGLAGHYALTVRSALPTSRPVIHDAAAAAYLKVAWSEKFVFNVHARSIFPCDPHSGVAVLFQYPACILETGDRVRLFARLRADVASLVPPTSLHYKAEQRVTRGQHSLYFDCDLFSERYVEYCFVYVSQAITGAVSDVRVDCVPTLPVRESDSGGWGSWSAWTTCSTSCGGGTRNRYRLCDSPPPRYGAKFCEGPSLETQHCGVGTGTWDCPRSVPEDDQEVADRPEVQAEVGPGCRCGCVVHLGFAKPRRLVATSSKSCPGRTFWLIQANEGHIIHLSMHYLRLPCASQWLKVRDGNGLSATLIALLTGNQVPGHPVASSGQYLLLEFFSDELTAGGVDCGGGFLAEAQQIPAHPNKTALLSGRDGIDFTAVSSAPVSPPNLTVVHVASLMFVCVVLAVSACLAAQYLHRYRKYQLAAAHEDTETITGSHCSRAASNATLLSEVISLKRFGRHRTHDRLQEEDEDGYDSTEHEYEVIESGPKDASSPVTTDKQSTLSLPCTPPGSPASLPRSTTLGSSQGSRLPNGKEMEAASEREWRIPRRPLSRGARTVSRGPSLATLTNVSRLVFTRFKGRCSPASSILSRNPKEHKDKRNMERLLAGSEFSLPGPEHDLELDYYDYNVTNAGTVPGSYLGMDPAYLLWIPPFAPGCWEEESEQALALADLHSQQDLVDRDQNGIELDMEQVTEFIPRAAFYLNPEQGSVTELDNKEVESSEEMRKSTKEMNKIPETKQNGVELQDTFTPKKSDSLRTVEQLPLHEFPTMRDQARYKGDKIQESPVRVHRRPGEKETRVEKSPNNDDIKFADDEDDEEELNSCDRIVITESNKNRHIRV